LPLPAREDIAPGSASTAQETGQSRGQGSTIGIEVSASGNTLKSTEDVGPVGIELRAMLKARKLLISLNGKNAKNS